MAMSDSVLAPVYDLQRDPRRRRIAMAGALLAGLALATVHWAGLFVGGALVGWTWPTLRRAVIGGLAFAVLALVAFALWLVVAGSLGDVLGTGQLLLVAVATPLVLGPLGALSRGLAPDAPRE